MCFLDSVMVILLGIDFRKCLEHANSVSLEQMCSVGILPVLTITAKGFVLWIVNVFLGGIMWQFGKKLEEKSTAKQLTLLTA